MKKIQYSIIIVCAIMFLPSIKAQTLIGVETNYPHAKICCNSIKYDTSSMKMKEFFEKWRNLQKTKTGRISIMHIGGSHVQAGTMSHTIRKNLIKECGISDRETAIGIIPFFRKIRIASSRESQSVGSGAPYCSNRSVWTYSPSQYPRTGTA